MIKGVMVILDGLGDRPSEKLGGKTPLEAARTPMMNQLVSLGQAGMMVPLASGIPVGTQTGTGLLMGLARTDVQRLARGPIEAAGVGLNLKNGEIALRCNFATLNPNGRTFDILDRRAGRISKETDTLSQSLHFLDLGHGITARFREATHHRAVLVLSGEDLSDAITDTDPGDGKSGNGVQYCVPREHTSSAIRTAEAVNAFVSRSYKLLRGHPVNKQREVENLLPANGIITRGAGKVHPLRNLVSYLGLKAALVTGEATLVGLGNLFGFSVIVHPGFTGTVDTDLEAKVGATHQALETHDLVFLHIKGPDIYAHDLDPVGKKSLIEKIDQALTPLVQADLVIGITGDHSTDSTWGTHIGDPVPALLVGPHCRRDEVTSFGETTCLKGGLGNLTSTSFLSTLLDHMQAMHNYRPHEYVFYQ